VAQKIENARETLMASGKKFLMNNKDGRFGKFNVRSLTAECSMASGTFYHYFESKDDFVIQIMEDDWSKVITAIDHAADMNSSLREKVENIYKSISSFGIDYRYSALGLISPTEKNMDKRKKSEDKMYAHIQLFLMREIELGEIELAANVESASYFLVQLFLAAVRKPEMSFDQLWKCMNFRDKSSCSV
jgi:AcrR family transcriptional regulator